MFGRLLNLFRPSREARVMRACGCVCRCPQCRDILNDRADVAESESGATVYRCPCGRESRWLFDAPVPLLLT